MLKILVPVLLFSACTPAAFHHLAQVSEVAAYGSLACDAGSTYTAQQGVQQYSEVNPFLGEHPQAPEVAGYFGVVGAGLFGVNRVLPDWARVLTNVAMTVVEVRAERGNHAIGVASCGVSR